MAPLLNLNISAGYPNKPEVLRGLKLEVIEGEIIGLVGRSGEGKSTITMSILGLLHHQGGACRGEILFRGRDLNKLSQREMRHVRGHEIALVPQRILSSLNPYLGLGKHLDEVWRAHRPPKKQDWNQLMESVNLPAEATFMKRYPRSLSVGMGQRFLIGMATIHRPALLLADEPTSALDTITQSEILHLFGHLSREHGMAVLFISHDLATVASVCHRVAILHEGPIVESGPVAEVFQHAQHPCTQQLIAAIPRLPFRR